MNLEAKFKVVNWCEYKTITQIEQSKFTVKAVL